MPLRRCLWRRALHEVGTVRQSVVTERGATPSMREGPPPSRPEPTPVVPHPPCGGTAAVGSCLGARGPPARIGRQPPLAPPVLPKSFVGETTRPGSSKTSSSSWQPACTGRMKWWTAPMSFLSTSSAASPGARAPSHVLRSTNPSHPAGVVGRPPGCPVVAARPPRPRPARRAGSYRNRRVSGRCRSGWWWCRVSAGEARGEEWGKVMGGIGMCV